MLKWSELSAKERNELVATKVVGWTRGEHLGLKRMVWRYPEGQVIDGFDWQNEVPRFSEEIAAAWEVVEKLRRERMNISVVSDEDGGWNVEMWDYNNRQSKEVFADTAPEAICLAALRACGVEIE